MNNNYNLKKISKEDEVKQDVNNELKSEEYFNMKEIIIVFPLLEVQSVLLSV